jgi:hypothetical protein
MPRRFWQPCEGPGGDQGLDEALIALWAAATRAIGTR